MTASNRTKRRHASRRSSARGFTLLEVMIVLGLTLLMMSLFATIFSMTGTFVSKQKGLGENDQSARILTTLVKTDLQARTMRLLAPFHPNMTNASLSVFAANQLGYFYVSENDPTDDTDDVLQFTINMTASSPGLSQFNNPAAGNQLYGNALYLASIWQPNTSYAPGAIVRASIPNHNTTGLIFKNKTGAAFTSGGTEPTWTGATVGGATVPDGGGAWTPLASPINQPDGDDGMMTLDGATPANRTLDPLGANPNNTGGSQFAEVTYFLRHGNLYRRVDLIRQPYDNSTSPSPGSSQPYDTDTPPGFLIPGAYPPFGVGPGNFYTDFDYAARMNAVAWQSATAYGLTTIINPAQSVVVPSPANGHTYTATTPGVSGAIQPAWPTVAGATVADGTITWTADVTPAFNFLGGTGTLENSLNNVLTTTGLPTAGAIPIGRPDNRFGFDQSYVNLVTAPASASLFNGVPREFAFQYNQPTNVVTGGFFPTGPMYFFGRYTQEETSNIGFQFPGNLPVVGGADFLPLGAASLIALDATNSTMWMLDGNPPTTPKSLAGGSRRGEDLLLTNVISFDVKLWDPHYSETAAGFDVNRNGQIDAGPGGFADVGHTATGDFSQPNNVFPEYGPQTFAGYTVTPGTWTIPAFAALTRTFNNFTYNYNNVFDTWYPAFNYDSLPRTYDLAPTDTATVNAPAPYRPRIGNTWTAGAAYTIGAQVDPVNKANGYVYQCAVAGTAGATEPFTLADTVGGTITDGGVTWTVLPPANVKAIQITVKYLDPTQNYLRQVTIVQSLTQ